MNKIISDFIDEVCIEIKYRKVHRDISEELQGHIYELMEEYLKDGMSEDEAAKKAVGQMGNPRNIGKDLHKTHKPKVEWSIIVLTGLMILMGATILFSIVKDEASMRTVEEFVRSYSIYTLIGLGLFIGCYFFDYTKLEKYSLPIYVGTLILLFTSTTNINGASRWFISYINGIPSIAIGGLQFTLASLVLPILIISFGGLTKRWATGDIKSMVKLIALAFLALVGCLLQPSLATALLLGSGFIVTITIAILSKSFNGNRKGFLMWIYGGGIAGMFLLFIGLLNPYKIARLKILLNPKLDPMGAGYLPYTVGQILAKAQFIGRSEGLYMESGRFIMPALDNEFILTYAIATFGWLAGIAISLIAILAVLRMLIATIRITSVYGRYLAVSISTVFGLQVIANILMNLRLFPTLGLGLPLISYGGASFVTTMALLGLLLGIYRRKDLVIDRVCK